MSRGTGAASASRRTTRYEVHRERVGGGSQVEEHLGLDRARLSAFAYALDWAGARFTGRIRVVEVVHVGGERCAVREVDELDERVTFLVLNQMRTPRASDLAAMGAREVRGEAA